MLSNITKANKTFVPQSSQSMANSEHVLNIVYVDKRHIHIQSFARIICGSEI